MDGLFDITGKQGVRSKPIWQCFKCVMLNYSPVHLSACVPLCVEMMVHVTTRAVPHMARLSLVHLRHTTPLPGQQLVQQAREARGGHGKDVGHGVEVRAVEVGLDRGRQVRGRVVDRPVGRG